MALVGLRAWLRARAAVLVVLAVVALSVASFGLGLHWGHELERSATAQRQATEARMDEAALRAAITDGRARELELQARLQAAHQFNATLKDRTDAAARHHLLAVQHCPTVGDAPGTAPASAAASAAVAAAGEPGLSVGAVGLWNSALAGYTVPAGACLTLDPADPACADAFTRDSGLGIGDAWANQRRNAEIERDNRARHVALIEHVRRHCDGAADPSPHDPAQSPR